MTPEQQKAIEVLKKKREDLKRPSPCPNCGYLQFCPCESCKDRLPNDMKPWIWVDGELIKCTSCGFTTHVDKWEDFSMEELRLSNALTLAISSIKQNEKLREALSDASASLETINRDAAKEEVFGGELSNIRAYAHNRSMVARQALAQEPK